MKRIDAVEILKLILNFNGRDVSDV